MKNLRIQGLRLHSVVHDVDDGSAHHHAGPKKCNDDIASSTVSQETAIVDVCPIPGGAEQSEESFAFLSRGGTVWCVGAGSGRRHWKADLTQVLGHSSGGEGQHCWRDLTFLESTDVLTAICSSGVIVSVTLNGAMELVGEFEHGILAESWSPDGEVLVLITVVPGESGMGRFVLISMNAHWDVLAEVDLPDCLDNESIALCWRPDGARFALSSVDASDNLRRIRIYGREDLSLQAIGRTEDGSGTLVPNLLGPLSWSGSNCSTLLTTIQRKGMKNLVAFLETNGLRHGQFTLSSSDVVVTHLSWNCESDLLAICLHDPSVNGQKVQLWHRCNYHWYLKQELRIECVTALKFHKDRPYTLFVMESQICREYEVQWDPSTMGGGSSLAYVVDGRQLHTTNFATAVIPPPMYGSSTSLPDSISQVITTRLVHPVIALVVHSDATISWVEATENPTSPVIARVSDWTETKDLRPTMLRDFCVMTQSMDEITLLAVAASFKTFDMLAEIKLSKRQIRVTHTHPLEDRVLNVTPWSDTTNGALIQLVDGQLLEYEYPSSIAPCDAENLLEPCPWIAAIKDTTIFGNVHDNHRQRIIVGLSSRYRLYMDELLLSDNASSFVLSTSHEYLCFATIGSRCQLRFLSLLELHSFDPFSGSDENYVRQGYQPRSIERGARLVAVLPHQPTVVVQMPRGNIETVHPRALLLRHSVHLIEEGNFSDAFAMLRRHRVDLNLLVDLDPITFLNSSEEFLEQIVSIDHINLFIANLQNVDTTKTSIPVPQWWRRKAETSQDLGSFDFQTKVNRVCHTLRAAMVQFETRGATRLGRTIPESHFLLPVLSSYAKENPPQLESALKMIKSSALAKHPTVSSNSPALFSDYAQKAIQYLAFLADYELLFETALRLYDFDIARAVARNSQMDPKSYLPMLKRYTELPENFARYKVDLQLKQFDSALRHLHRSSVKGECLPTSPATGDEVLQRTYGNDSEACMALIEEHHLYKVGLELFDDEPLRSRVMVSLGDHLLRDQKLPSAALNVYLACSSGVDLERAKVAARQCHDWRTLFSLCDDPSLSSSSDPAALHRRGVLARQVADELVAEAESATSRRNLLMDAARVLLDYGENEILAAIDILLKGEHWSEGRRLAHHSGRKDLERRCVDAAAAYAHQAISDLQERSTAFAKAMTLFLESLRIRKDAISRGEGIGDGIDDGADDSGSLFSLASNASNQSATSGTSMGSTRSSVSSVISVKSTTTFSVTGNVERNRHKSKFNNVGDRRNKQSKKKKERKKRIKTAPGSDQELQVLVQTLRSSCVDKDYSGILEETITFLLQNENVSLARQLYDAYNDMCSCVHQQQLERRVAAVHDRQQSEAKARREGSSAPPVAEIRVEGEVDRLSCAPLPSELVQVFSYISGTL